MLITTAKQYSFRILGTALLCGTVAQAQDGPQCQTGCAASYTIGSPNPSYVYNATCNGGTSAWDYGLTVSVSGVTNGICAFGPGGCGGTCSLQVYSTYAVAFGCNGQIFLNPWNCGTNSGPFTLSACGSPGAECFLWSGTVSADCGGGCGVSLVLNEAAPGTSTSVAVALNCAACP